MDPNVGTSWSGAEAVRAELPALLERYNGELPRAVARVAAELAGKTERTIYRWASEVRVERPKEGLSPDANFIDRLVASNGQDLQFDDLAMAMMHLVGGNQKRFAEELEDAGVPMPSAATVSRRFSKVGQHRRAGTRTGQKTRFTKLIQILHSAQRPLEAVQLDEFILDIDVMPTRGTTTFQPRLLLLIDDFSRMCVGWACLRQPVTSLDVVALLADALDVRAYDDTGVLVGGIFHTLVPDNARAFTSLVVEGALGPIGVDLAPAFPYTPTGKGKGKVERAGQTIQERIVVGRPGWRTRSERSDGTDLLGIEDRFVLGEKDFLEHVEREIDRYNRRPHSALGGRSPLEAATSVPVVRERVPDETLARMLLPAGREAGRRTMHTTGIKFDGFHFNGFCVRNYVDRKVTLRAFHHRRDKAAVFDGNDFIGWVYDVTRLPADEADRIRADRRLQIDAVSQDARSAREMMREASARVAAGEAIPGGPLVDHIARLAGTSTETRQRDEELEGAGHVIDLGTGDPAEPELAYAAPNAGEVDDADGAVRPGRRPPTRRTGTRGGGPVPASEPANESNVDAWLRLADEARDQEVHEDGRADDGNASTSEGPDL